MEGKDAILLEPAFRKCPSCGDYVWGSSCGCATAGSDDADRRWTPSVMLPYVENQKYTLGSKYISRENQGEFIFVHTAKNPGNLADITCSEGNYWLTPAGKRIIFVNDVQLEKSCRTKLNFGDRIALLGKVRPRRRGLNREKKNESLDGFFLFKERRHTIERHCEQDPGMPDLVPDDNKNVDFTAGQDLVLSNILSYLPFHTLKTARLVCRQWDTEASRIIRKNSNVVLNYYFPHNYKYPIDSMRLFRYFTEVKNLQPTGWDLQLPPFTPSTGPSIWKNSTRGQQLALKLADDLNWFLLPDRCHHITRLDLGGKILCEADYKIHLSILVKLQVTLIELELSWFLQLVDVVECAFPVELELNKLVMFTFAMGTSDVGVLANQTLISSWAAAIQRVKSLRLNCDDDEESVFINCLLEYEQPLPNLVEFVTLSTREIVLNFLLRLTMPLKKLKLSNLRCLQRRENHAKFENLIRNHAATLESLNFVYDDNDEDEERLTIHLPALPRLKKLFVEWMEFANLKIRFPSAQDDEDVLDYARHLPRLEILSLAMFPCSFPSTSTWENQRDRLAIFFPTVDRNGDPIETRSVTLRELYQTIYVSYIPGFCCVSEFPSDLPLTDMFPNVWNYWMTKRRREELSSQIKEDPDKMRD